MVEGILTDCNSPGGTQDGYPHGEPAGSRVAVKFNYFALLNNNS